MRPRFTGTRQHPRIIGGSGATQRFRTAQSRARIAGKTTIRVDLAALVSKYVAQTERNIDRLLNEARDSNALLYLDEADALFEGENADETALARLRSAKRYLQSGARRRRLPLMTGKPRPALEPRK